MKSLSFFLFCALLIGSGCKGNAGDAGPAGPSGSASFTSYIWGDVFLRNEYGNTISDRRGVTIAVNGTTLSQTVDSTGRFFIDGIRGGVYTVVASRAGFGTVRPNFEIFGNTYSSLTLDSLPSYTVSNLRGAFTGTGSGAVRTDTLDFNAAVPATRTRRVIYFYGSSPNVSSNPANFLTNQISNTISAGATRATISVPRSTFTNAGFVSGQTVYVIGYGVSVGLNAYRDPLTQRDVYPALTAASNVVSFQLP
jgi:hypothetical protein